MNAFLGSTRKAQGGRRSPEASRRALYFALLIILVSGVFAALLLPASASSSTTVGGFTVTFLGVDPNENGTSTWNYSLVWDGTDHELSHFIFEVGSCAEIVGYSSSGASDVGTGYDKKTGLTGIKWEFSSFSANTPVALSFTVDGHYSAGQIRFGAKAGSDPNVGTITGPSLACSVLEDDSDDSDESDDSDDNSNDNDDQDSDDDSDDGQSDDEGDSQDNDDSNDNQDGNDEDTTDDSNDDQDDEDTSDDTTDDTTPNDGDDKDNDTTNPTNPTNPPVDHYYPSTPSATVLSEVVATPAIVETETPVTTVAQETATTDSTPSRKELPYTGMNGLGALMSALVLIASGMFIFRNSKV